MGRTVSVVIPARDEAPHIRACVRSVLAQEGVGVVELIVVDGRSSDDTAVIARDAGATVVTNPDGTIPVAMNRGVAAAAGDVIARFDAHAEMPPGYLGACLAALDEEPGAVNVGGWRRAEGAGPWGRAVAAALASPLGVGNARIWRPPPPGSTRVDTETVPLGCFPRGALDDVGGWREDLLANEDFELNHRLRAAGGRVVFDPAIWSVYHPRESLGAIAAQYWRYGRWKAVMAAGSPESLLPRQLAPPALVAVAAAAVLPSPLRRAARLALAAYGVTLLGAAGTSGGGWRVAPVLATMHLAWGASFAVHAPRGTRRR
ncbi:MAG: hypothetical protein QOG87_3786 [Actinomycetota bacterium]|jgi:glycosyltransferase involved in cell wall biosynthesis